MAESFHDGSRMSILRDEHRRVAVAKVMKPGCLRQPSSDHGRLEVPCIEVGVPVRSTPRRGEDKVQAVLVRRSSPSFLMPNPGCSCRQVSSCLPTNS